MTPTRERDVIQAVRHAYVQTDETMMEICLRFEVHHSTVRAWRAKYGWPKRSRNHSKRKSWDAREAGSRPAPRRWRCDCGRVNLEPHCPTCGHRPAWTA